jgi:hypothetical protein
VRKGALRAVMKLKEEGHVLTVFDENNEVVQVVQVKEAGLRSRGSENGRMEKSGRTRRGQTVR